MMTKLMQSRWFLWLLAFVIIGIDDWLFRPNPISVTLIGFAAGAIYLAIDPKRRGS